MNQEELLAVLSDVIELGEPVPPALGVLLHAIQADGVYPVWNDNQVGSESRSGSFWFGWVSHSMSAEFLLHTMSVLVARGGSETWL